MIKSTQRVLFKIIPLIISPDRRPKAYLFRPGMPQRRDVESESGREKLIYLVKHHSALAGASEVPGEVGFGRSRVMPAPPRRPLRQRAGPGAAEPEPRGGTAGSPNRTAIGGTRTSAAAQNPRLQPPRPRSPSCGPGSQRHRSHGDGQSILKIYLQSCVQHEGITFRIHIFIHI